MSTQTLAYIQLCGFNEWVWWRWHLHHAVCGWEPEPTGMKSSSTDSASLQGRHTAPLCHFKTLSFTLFSSAATPSSHSTSLSHMTILVKGNIKMALCQIIFQERYFISWLQHIFCHCINGLIFACDVGFRTVISLSWEETNTFTLSLMVSTPCFLFLTPEVHC